MFTNLCYKILDPENAPVDPSASTKYTASNLIELNREAITAILTWREVINITFKP